MLLVVDATENMYLRELFLTVTLTLCRKDNKQSAIYVASKSDYSQFYHSAKFSKIIQHTNEHTHAHSPALLQQEAQLMLTTGSTRLAVSRGQQTWYHSTCYI